MIYKAPAKTYHGYALVRIVRPTKDLRGQLMYEVEALHGTPWSDCGYCGWTLTDTRSFYPEHLIPVENEKAPEATETFSQNKNILVTASV